MPKINDTEMSENSKVISSAAKCRKLPVVVVIGAGAGIGMHVAKRFARGDNGLRQRYHVCLVRRSNSEGLKRAVRDINNEAGTGSTSSEAAAAATGFLLDVTKPNVMEQLVNDIETDIGPLAVVVYNLGAQIGNQRLSDTSYKQFEMGWKLGTFGLFRVCKSVLPFMANRGCGTVLVTSSTAAIRGNKGQHSHAAAMGGRRMLCQTLNAEYAKQGVHIAHIIVDGGVDAPDTLGRMLGSEKFQQLRKEKELIKPESLADTYWHLAHQHSSAWTFELDLRSRSDVPW
eukprot:CAMPEP_0195524244 /NCGR_PEP_ID=MMETSP0794_2-20130614/23965_1 /TAXON_ID=515487 /ORGANISM="Stephanopyxis turris, Strain CCMP 815" /LENGTH=285 /DNA_ID=CAMNT_0040654421 /DNA_START=113 /DNA_END=967 /DNA_ORIENTATION=+